MILSMTRKDRATVTLDPELITDIKSRVGQRGVSRYLNEVLRERLRYEAMSAYLAERERERGPLSEELVREVASLMDNAYDPVNRERTRLRLERVLGQNHTSTRLPDIVTAAKRAKIRLETVLGKKASIEIDGDEIRVIDVEIVPQNEVDW